MNYHLRTIDRQVNNMANPSSFLSCFGICALNSSDDSAVVATSTLDHMTALPARYHTVSAFEFAKNDSTRNNNVPAPRPDISLHSTQSSSAVEPSKNGFSAPVTNSREEIEFTARYPFTYLGSSMPAFVKKMAPSPFDEFTLFQELAVELRLAIWKLSMSEPRTVYLSKEDGSPRFEVAFKIPPQLHVNRESRLAGQEYYLQPFFHIRGCPAYMRFETDTLLVESADLLNEYEYQTAFGEAPMHHLRQVFNQVRFLDYNGYLHQRMIHKLIETFKNAREVRVTGMDGKMQELKEQWANKVRGGGLQPAISRVSWPQMLRDMILNEGPESILEIWDVFGLDMS